jgi:hypothetical protein
MPVASREGADMLPANHARKGRPTTRGPMERGERLETKVY